MSEHRAIVRWKRESTSFEYETYNRNHTWSFGDGLELPASAAPEFFGDPSRVDPEQAFVAALSSCHMLTLLAIAAKKRWVVERYEDAAIGFMEKDDAGRLAVTRVLLRPKIEFGGSTAPSDDDLHRLHDQAHRNCFIANSVRTQITVEGFDSD